MITRSPVDAHLSATLILLRDGAEGLEVLMTARHAAASFAAGALVFPGGRLDAGDLALARLSAAAASLDPEAAALRAAAIRETWEEGGVLLARPRGAARLLTAAEVALRRQQQTMLGDAEIEPALDLLLPFAHWITPVDQPKRFDTHFFVATYAGDQQAMHDGQETVEARWVNPRRAVEDADRGLLKLVLPTRLNLLRLARSPSVADVLDATKAQPVVTILPEVVTQGGERVVRIPLEAGYGVSEIRTTHIPRA